MTFKLLVYKGKISIYHYLYEADVYLFMYSN